VRRVRLRLSSLIGAATMKTLRSRKPKNVKVGAAVKTRLRHCGDPPMLRHCGDPPARR